MTVVVCANRSYRILQVELARAGVTQLGPKAQRLTGYLAESGPNLIEAVLA